MPRLPVAVLLTLAMAVTESVALARDPAAATALFDEGKRLVEKGDLEAACPKFLASLEADPRLGTKLSLAACYERAGKTASAWAAFQDAAAMADKAGPSEKARGEFAVRHVRDLEPKLSRLRVSAPDPVPGLVITRDGQIVHAATYGVAVPVDPGAHEIAGNAPGYETWTQTVTIGAEPETTVTVPALTRLETPAPSPTPPSPVPSPVPSPSPGRPGPSPAPDAPSGGTPPLRWVGYGTGAAGVALVAVGLVFGAKASSKWSDAEKMCTGDSEPLQCTHEGVTLRDEAASAATLSTVFVAVGAVAIGGGITMILLSPSRSPRKVGLVPTVSPDGVGLVVAGGF